MKYLHIHSVHSYRVELQMNMCSCFLFNVSFLTSSTLKFQRQIMTILFYRNYVHRQFFHSFVLTHYIPRKKDILTISLNILAAK